MRNINKITSALRDITKRNEDYLLYGIVHPFLERVRLHQLVQSKKKWDLEHLHHWRVIVAAFVSSNESC